jgi:hypothetical protein
VRHGPRRSRLDALDGVLEIEPTTHPSVTQALTEHTAGARIDSLVEALRLPGSAPIARVAEQQDAVVERARRNQLHRLARVTAAEQRQAAAMISGFTMKT